jgi:hypothetical protein
MERTNDPGRDDVDPAEALGGAAALPLPEGQPRGAVPTDREAPRTDVAPESVDAEDRPDEG